MLSSGYMATCAVCQGTGSGDHAAAALEALAGTSVGYELRPSNLQALQGVGWSETLEFVQVSET